MSSLLRRWGQRVTGELPGLKPRIPSRFETTGDDGPGDYFSGITEITEEIPAESSPPAHVVPHPEPRHPSATPEDRPKPSSQSSLPRETRKPVSDGGPQDRGKSESSPVSRKPRATPSSEETHPPLEKPVPATRRKKDRISIDKNPDSKDPRPIKAEKPAEKVELPPVEEPSEKRLRSLETGLDQLRKWMSSDRPEETPVKPETETGARARSRDSAPARTLPPAPLVSLSPTGKRTGPSPPPTAPVEINIGTIIVRANVANHNQPRRPQRPTTSRTGTLAGYLARRASGRF